MRILHIGDLHFKAKNTFDQNKIAVKFLEKLKTVKPVDFIFFSGDLVYSGNNPKDFVKAHEYLFKPLFELFGLSEKELFICQGNHDIDRTKIVSAIITEFTSKPTIKRDFLQNWYDKVKNDREASIKPSLNFYNYLNSLAHEDRDLIKPMFTLHKRSLNNVKIGIVTLNSSWFSADRDDEKELLFLPSLIEEAVTHIKDCEIKILMQHHPLNFYKDTLSLDIQDIIHSNFHLLLTGHEHVEGLGTTIKSNNGIYWNKTKASLCYDEGEIGFAIIETDEKIFDSFITERFHYIKEAASFSALDTLRIPIPTSEVKYQANVLRKKIFNKYQSEISQSNLLLLDYSEHEKNGFLDTFTEPVLARTPDEQRGLQEIEFRVSVKEIEMSDSNFLIFGKDKCGKTSLLKKIFLSFLHDHGENSKIPVFVDYKQLENEFDKFEIQKIISNYYSLNNTESKKILENGNLVLLIDNLDINSIIHDDVLSFLSANPNVRFVACSEYLTSRIFAEELDSLDYEKIYFKKLGRVEIRAYTNKLPNIKVEDQDEVLEKVTLFCNQLQLPVNFWTVSLILLIYKKSNDDYSKNLFSVLDSCVDEMLQKRKLLFKKYSLKFEQYKTLCSQVAFKLFKDYKNEEYSASDVTMMNLIQEYVDRNQRIIIGNVEIFTFLLDTGIFKKKQNGKYTFRLNGIFEYFLAYYIKENDSFKEDLINSDSEYLQFKNELEIYSGFNRSDTKFLKDIFEKTKGALNDYHLRYPQTTDTLLNAKIDEAFDFEKQVRKLIVSEAMTIKEKDESYDKIEKLGINSDVQVKKEIEATKLNVEIVEKYLTILARVLKNSDAITDTNLIVEIFDYLLDSYVIYGFYLIDEFKAMAQKTTLEINTNSEEREQLIFGEEILTLLSRIVPILAQVMLYDGLGHINFTRIINEKIAKLRMDFSKNQYKLYVLYFLLMDIDLKANKNLIDDVFTEITLAPLKVATSFKLKYYLSFKTDKGSALEQFFKNYVQKADLRLDEKNKPAALQGELAKKTKTKLIKK